MSDKATLVVVVPSIVALLAQLEDPQLVVSTRPTDRYKTEEQNQTEGGQTKRDKSICRTVQ
jgi:hypothetical protein